MDIKIEIKKLHPDAVVPEYAHSGDAGFDFHALEDTRILPGQAAIMHTGLAVAIPDGFEMQIRLRSSAALRLPLIIPNAPATIDAGYRGELGIILRNIGDREIIIGKGERIAQGVVAPVARAVFALVDTLPESARGAGGYGSSGVK